MSNKKVMEATVPDWSGPFFPKAFEVTQRRYGYLTVRFNNMLFDDVADQLNKGKVLVCPVTSDVKSRFKTPWSHAVGFSRHKRRCRVYFPMALDSSREDGTYATRHVALYIQGEAPCEDEIEQIGREFAEDFARSYQALYGKK